MAVLSKKEGHNFYTVIKGVGSCITGLEPGVDPTEEDINSMKAEMNTLANPKVGKMYYVVSFKGDWYRTNIVTDILEENDEEVVFKTASESIYKWIKD